MISRRFKNEAFNISERYSQSLLLFLNSMLSGYQGHIFATFVNAILVDVYNFLRVYRYFSGYSLRTKHTTFLSSTASFVHRSFSFSHHLTLPKVGSTFQMTGRHDLIGSSRSVEIVEAASGSSTSSSKSYFLFKLHDPTFEKSSRSVEIVEAASGSSTSSSKSYFLFKLHDPTSGESGRQQKLTTRLSSCILDMGVKL